MKQHNWTTARQVQSRDFHPCSFQQTAPKWKLVTYTSRLLLFQPVAACTAARMLLPCLCQQVCLKKQWRRLKVHAGQICRQHKWKTPRIRMTRWSCSPHLCHALPYCLITDIVHLTIQHIYFIEVSRCTKSAGAQSQQVHNWAHTSPSCHSTLFLFDYNFILLTLLLFGVSVYMQKEHVQGGNHAFPKPTNIPDLIVCC